MEPVNTVELKMCSQERILDMEHNVKNQEKTVIKRVEKLTMPEIADEPHKGINVLQVAEADARYLLVEAEEQVAVKIAVEDVKTFGEFWLKFLNDWVFDFASGLAYQLLMAMFPI